MIKKTFFIFLISILLPVLSFASTQPSNLGSVVRDKYFVSLNYNYPFFIDSHTKGNIAVTTEDTDYVLDTNNLRYQSLLFPQLAFGHRYSQWFSLAIAFQQINTIIDPKSSVPATTDNLTRNNSMNANLNMTTALIKGFFNLGNGFHIGKLKTAPFANIGVGISHWNFTAGHVSYSATLIEPTSGNNFIYEVGLGAKSWISRRLSINYGINYTFLGKYKTGTNLFGYNTDNSMIKEAVSATLSAIIPYVGLSYSF